MKMKKLALAAITAASSVALAETTETPAVSVPEVGNVKMVQAANRLVTITYTLTQDAVVTLDIQTNANLKAEADDPGWTSIGGEAVSVAVGDVWKKCSGKSTYTITWQADQAWPGKDGNGFKIGSNGARARVTAWPLDNTPDYMVVDISAAAKPNTQRYYPAVEFLPGGLFGRDEYRTTQIVMRKIMAKNVTWTMGSTSDERWRTAGVEDTHLVMLTNNYYIGVFEVTQKQWSLIQQDAWPSHFNNIEYRSMRPVEKVSYNEIRNSGSDNVANSNNDWPADPNENSFLGRLRLLTGIDFDLPSETQWEFAARAGHGDGKWGDGSKIKSVETDENLRRLARYASNDGKINGTDTPASSCTAKNGTAEVGTYDKNSWGLYDMHGNVYEWCLDWYEKDITKYNGKVNINFDSPSKNLSGENGANRVKRGGTWWGVATNARPAARFSAVPTTRDTGEGFRLVCTAGLQ